MYLLFSMLVLVFKVVCVLNSDMLRKKQGLALLSLLTCLALIVFKKYIYRYTVIHIFFIYYMYIETVYNYVTLQ